MLIVTIIIPGHILRLTMSVLKGKPSLETLQVCTWHSIFHDQIDYKHHLAGMHDTH